MGFDIQHPRAQPRTQPTTRRGSQSAAAGATHWPLCPAGWGPVLYATCSEMSALPPKEPLFTHLSFPCKCECYSQPRVLDTGHQQRGRFCPPGYPPPPISCFLSSVEERPVQRSSRAQVQLTAEHRAYGGVGEGPPQTHPPCLETLTVFIR